MLALSFLDIHVHTHCICSLFTHLPFHHALHKSAADFELTLASLILRGETASFFASRKAKQSVLSIWIGTLSSLYSLCSIWLFLSYVPLLMVKTEWSGTTCFLAYATLQFVHSNWNLLPRVLPSRNLSKPKNPQCAWSSPPFFFKLL